MLPPPTIPLTNPWLFSRGLALAAVAICLLAAERSASAQDTGETTIYNFTQATGVDPNATLIQGSDGNFYGTTARGGANNEGTVFQVTPAGVLTTLYSFNEAVNGNGAFPQAGLVQGSDGNFYGTTEAGGNSSAGTVFQVTPAGVPTILHRFDPPNDGNDPEAGLVQGGDGNFYGTAGAGGPGGGGTIFSISPAGEFHVLHAFSGGDGSAPAAALIQGRDGNFYGTTARGGLGGGTVFSITPDGGLTTLYRFGSADGDGNTPAAALVQDGDGNLYGTTASGALDNYGVVFKITPGGVLSNLHVFNYEDGCDPYGLILGRDGNLYGVTGHGGMFNQNGTIYQLTPDGRLSTVYEFTDDDATTNLLLAPTGLVQGSDGDLYGTERLDDPGENGALFRVNIAAGLAYAVPTVSVALGGDGRAQYGGEVGKVVFQRTGNPAPLTVEYRVSGAAGAGVDYKPLSGTLNIPAGATQVKLKVKALHDPKRPGKHRLRVALLPSFNDLYKVGTVGPAKITVTDGE